MTSITIDSGTHRKRIADVDDDSGERRGTVAESLRAALDLVSACRGRTALAMMSERELSDLGLLPFEVRSEV